MAAALNWSLRIELVKRIEGRPILSVFRPRKMPRERQPPLKVGGLVRGNRIFPQSTRREMKNVHLFFLKLFGCMICEAKANGHEVPIDIAPFSNAIMSGQPHPEVYLQFGKCDGMLGRSNLHCWTTDRGSVLAGWLYELDNIAVSIMFAPSRPVGAKP